MIKRKGNKWISHQQISDTAKINLLCFSFAGGSPSFFAPWKKLVPEWVNLMPVLYPERESRMKEKMPGEMQELVKDFIQDNPGILEKPYAIWGHCSGSLIGLETAFKESNDQNPPKAFIVSGCEAPEYALNRLQLKKDFSEVRDEDILNDLLLFGLMSPEMVKDESISSYFLPIYRADLSMFSKYKCSDEVKLDCPALIMNGSEDKMIKAECIPDWSKRFSNTKYEMYPGGHYFVTDRAEDICNRICSFLEEVL